MHNKVQMRWSCTMKILSEKSLLIAYRQFDILIREDSFDNRFFERLSIFVFKSLECYQLLHQLRQEPLKELFRNTFSCERFLRN